MSDHADTITCPCTGDTLRRTAGPRDDWKMPEPQLCDCAEIANEDDGGDRKPVAMHAIAYLEDAWALTWRCRQCGDEGEGYEIEWPYEQDEYAKADDLRALGFEVI